MEQLARGGALMCRSQIWRRAAEAQRRRPAGFGGQWSRRRPHPNAEWCVRKDGHGCPRFYIAATRREVRPVLDKQMPFSRTRRAGGDREGECGGLITETREALERRCERRDLEVINRSPGDLRRVDAILEKGTAFVGRFTAHWQLMTGDHARGGGDARVTEPLAGLRDSPSARCRTAV